MARRILALSEGFDVSEEALGYASALARRVDAAVSLLLLLPLDLEPTRDEEALARRGASLLRRKLEELPETSRPARWHVRTGDPWSELCKFAALNGPFQMVVWASDAAFIDGRPGRGNWVGRVQEGLGCPVVTAHRRVAGPRQRKTGGDGAKKP